MMYNYLVVGSGLYGAIFAHEAKKNRKDSSCSRQATEYCWKCLHRENRRY